MGIEKGLFVTGTDTDIGKTVISALLVAALRKKYTVKYWKPVQTGIESDCDTAMVRTLARCSDAEIHDEGIRLERPLSPHLAAKKAGVEFSVGDIVRLIPEETNNEFWIVEGAGGVMVPLNGTELMIDLIIRLGLPAAVVSRTGLGTINHSLLTIKSIRDLGGTVAGVFMNGSANGDNTAAVRKYGSVGIMVEVPVLSPLSPDSIEKAAGALDIPF